MDINSLHKKALEGHEESEKNLFINLTEKFRYLVQLNIRNKEDIEEIVQDTIMVIAGSYKEVEFETNFSGWAYNVLKNNMRHFYRTKKYEKNRFADSDDGIEQGINPDPYLRIKILDCIKKICRSNRRYARMLNLYSQGFAMEEICSRLSINRSNAYSLLFRARALLEICLDKGDIK
jgi:RNA polymerase sigma factor (sigma-70 family)